LPLGDVIGLTLTLTWSYLVERSRGSEFFYDALDGAVFLM
jgi:hypothetical protein